MPDEQSESTDRPSNFQWPVRIYIEDTDAGGIVFYANYLRFMERARTELIRHLGFPRIEQIDERVIFVVHRLEVRYRIPAVLDDELTVTANPHRISNTSIHFQQQVLRNGELLVEAEVHVACISREQKRPARLPQTLKEALRSISSQGE